MDRSRAIFEWVFGLPPEPHRPAPGPAAHGPGPAAANASAPYAIDFLSVADHVTLPPRARARSRTAAAAATSDGRTPPVAQRAASRQGMACTPRAREEALEQGGEGSREAKGARNMEAKRACSLRRHWMQHDATWSTSCWMEHAAISAGTI